MPLWVWAACALGVATQVAEAKEAGAAGVIGIITQVTGFKGTALMSTFSVSAGPRACTPLMPGACTLRTTPHPCPALPRPAEAHCQHCCSAGHLCHHAMRCLLRAAGGGVV